MANGNRLGTKFWIRRFLWWYVVAFLFIAGSQWLLRGRTVEVAVSHGLLWALISATFVVCIMLFKSRGS